MTDHVTMTVRIPWRLLFAQRVAIILIRIAHAVMRFGGFGVDIAIQPMTVEIDIKSLDLSDAKMRKLIATAVEKKPAGEGDQ